MLQDVKGQCLLFFDARIIADHISIHFGGNFSMLYDSSLKIILKITINANTSYGMTQHVIITLEYKVLGLTCWAHHYIPCAFKGAWSSRNELP